MIVLATIQKGWDRIQAEYWSIVGVQLIAIFIEAVVFIFLAGLTLSPFIGTINNFVQTEGGTDAINTLLQSKDDQAILQFWHNAVSAGIVPSLIIVCILLVIVATVVSSFGNAAVISAIHHAFRGKKVTLTNTFTAARQRMLPLLGNKLLSAGAILGLMAIGFLALFPFIAPGFAVFLFIALLTIRWAMAQFAVVVDDKPSVEALGYSNKIVMGSSWSVFWLLVFVGAIIAIPAQFLSYSHSNLAISLFDLFVVVLYPPIALAILLTKYEELTSKHKK